MEKIFVDRVKGNVKCQKSSIFYVHSELVTFGLRPPRSDTISALCSFNKKNFAIFQCLCFSIISDSERGRHSNSESA